MININKIIHSDCIEGMKSLPDNSVDCCITSPPYFGLRDYGHDGQIGLESTPELFVTKIVEVFTEVKRVLKDEGTLFLNLGDSYFGSGKGGNPEGSKWKGFIPRQEGKMPGSSKKVNAPRAVSCGTSGKEPVSYQENECLCGSLCDVCRKAYQIGKSHKDYLHDPKQVVLPSSPIHERKEFESDHVPTLDLIHQEAHISNATQDLENFASLEHEQHLSSHRSKSASLIDGLNQNAATQIHEETCLFCSNSFVPCVEQTGHKKVCNCDIAQNDHPLNSGKSGTSFLHKAYNKDTEIKPQCTLKPKDLIGIPWMVAFALRSSGWYLRQDIIWHKPNPMPESVTDRCTKSHEYIFLLSKSPKYYYDQDAIRTTVKDSTVQRMMQQIENQKGSERVPGKTNGTMKTVGPGRKPAPQDNRGGNQGSTNGIKAYSHRGTGDKKLTGHSGNFDSDGNLIGGGLANKKSVWTVTTKPFSEAHFATFPQDLIIDMIKAGCPEFVCNKCGKARKRIVENEYKVHENWYGDKTKKSKNSRGKDGNSYKEKIGINQVGFTDCECNAGFSPGVVLDPFMGAGTTALVARKLNRNYIGFELNADYIKIAEKRIHKEIGIFQ